jgi:type I restriction enzyme, R subunit
MVARHACQCALSGQMRTLKAHREDRVYLEGPFRGQVNSQIRASYAERGRYDELTDEKYIDRGAIFDIMAVTIINHNLAHIGWPA